MDFSIGKQEFKMAAQVSQVCTADDILGPFGTCEKVVYLKKKFSVITNNIQVADRS